MIALTDFDPIDLRDLDETWLTPIGKFYSEAGPAYTAHQDGKAILALGLVLDPASKVAHAWASVSDRARANPFFLHRITCRLLAMEVDKHQIETVTVLVRKGDEGACRWIERLGFEAMPDRDLAFYVRRTR